MSVIISVIIPCFNNQQTIDETIQSVLQQSLTNWELIIVDDGSTDESVNLINSIIEVNNSKNIKLICQENSGPSKSRNKGAAIANGKYLLFLDADDLIHSSYLEKAVKLLEENSQLHLVYSNAEFFEAKKGAWKLPAFSKKGLLLENSIFMSAVIRTEDFRIIGGIDETLNYIEDWELWLRLVYAFDGVYKINETLFYYRKQIGRAHV